MSILNLGIQNLALVRKKIPEWDESAVASVGSMKGVRDAHDALKKYIAQEGRSENWQFLKASKSKVHKWLTMQSKTKDFLLSTGNRKGLLMQERDIKIGRRLATGENISGMKMVLLSPG